MSISIPVPIPDSVREINTLLGLMHDKGISTFLVTNAQFPEAIETLRPVTQLYCSIDASNKESLKAVDQPLHQDFWERFLHSIDAIRYTYHHHRHHHHHAIIIAKS